MSKRTKILGFIVAIIVLGAATFGGVYIALTKSEGSEKVEVKQEEGGKVEESFHEIGEIFVNLTDDNAKRYVKLNLSLGFDKKNKDLLAEITEKQVVMRHVAINYIRSCTTKDFEPANEEQLKKELIERLNKELTKGTILNIYISEIMVQ